MKGLRVWLRALVIVAGGLTAGSVTWIVWGLSTSGDHFAGGSPVVWLTLSAAGIGGALAAAGSRSRRTAAFVLLSAAIVSAFWIVAPDGWWASSPPARPSAE